MSRTEALGYIEKSRDNLHMEFCAEDYLKDLLSAACLLIEDGLEIAFSHRSFQEYFVALYILSASPEIQKKLLERYWQNLWVDSVIRLLYELNAELIERVIIVPELKKLFSEIGVKHKVGITHTVKYIKYTFKYITISRYQVVALHYLHDKKILEVIEFLAVFLEKGPECFTSELFSDLAPIKNICREYFETHNIEEKEVQISINSMTYRTPFLFQMIKNTNYFSIQTLQDLFEEYTFLKMKHSNKSQDLDELLGI